ncbi:hypothetical protein HAX54_008047 [Datura stramonium]|uniref:DUF223 domain-containing protein n=1 Tax=Datura stramonium TaxID=4076 RepID=A0ABS8TDE9_DATST|nr:hypothetical protein [Datura stramonium]
MTGVLYDVVGKETVTLSAPNVLAVFRKSFIGPLEHVFPIKIYKAIKEDSSCERESLDDTIVEPISFVRLNIVNKSGKREILRDSSVEPNSSVGLNVVGKLGRETGGVTSLTPKTDASLEQVELSSSSMPIAAYGDENTVISQLISKKVRSHHRKASVQPVAIPEDVPLSARLSPVTLLRTLFTRRK